MEKKLLIVVTHSSDAPDRAAAALAIGSAALAEGRDVAFFMLNEGALLIKRGFAETISGQEVFPPIPELLAGLVTAGQRFFVCSTCATHYGIGSGDILPNSEIAGAPVLLALADEREVLNF